MAGERVEMTVDLRTAGAEASADLDRMGSTEAEAEATVSAMYDQRGVTSHNMMDSSINKTYL